MDTLMAEDLLLLLHDETRGRFRARTVRHPTLAGALLIELALRGVATMEVPSQVWRATGDRPGDALLDRALDVIDAHPARATELLAPVGEGLEAALLQRLVDSGLLRRHGIGVLGRRLFTTWTMPDKSPRVAVRDDVVSAILSDEDPPVRTGSLIALLDSLGDVVRELDHRVGSPSDLERRAHAHARGGWLEGAAREVVRASRAEVRKIWDFQSEMRRG